MDVAPVDADVADSHRGNAVIQFPASLETAGRGCNDSTLPRARASDRGPKVGAPVRGLNTTADSLAAVLILGSIRGNSFQARDVLVVIPADQ
jgi:hypothetical protein